MEDDKVSKKREEGWNKDVHGSRRRYCRQSESNEGMEIKSLQERRHVEKKNQRIERTLEHWSAFWEMKFPVHPS